MTGLLVLFVLKLTTIVVMIATIVITKKTARIQSATRQAEKEALLAFNRQFDMMLAQIQRCANHPRTALTRLPPHDPFACM